MHRDIKELLNQDYLSFDIETTGWNLFHEELQMASWDDNGTIGYWTRDMGPFPKQIMKKLADPNVIKIIHSSQFDIPMWRMKTGCHIRTVCDTQLNEKVILGGADNTWTASSLKETIYSRYKIVLEKETRDTFIGYRGPITKKQINYGVKDIKYLRTLMEDQLKDIERDELVEVMKLENRQAEVTAEMRYNGIEFDEQMWIDIAEENLAEYTKRIKKLPKEVNNWNSEKQVKKYFLDYHDIVIESYKYLNKIKTENKVFKQFLRAREIYSSVSTYGLGFLFRDKKRQLRLVDPDGRVRPSFDQIVDTGRYSCSKPNLQNQPSFGKHRYAYVARRGWKLVIGDFTGQELGIIAVGSKDPVWLEAMRKRHDVHAVMAAKVFDDWKRIGEKNCTFPFRCKCPKHEEKRRPAKDLNFGIAYGQGIDAFCEKSGLGSKGRNIYKKYKRVNPKVNTYLEGNARLAVKRGYSRTLPPFNRIRYLSGEEWRVRNQGKNSPIQGSGADMMKLAMCMMYDYILDNDLLDTVKIVLTVHDEVICEVKTLFAKQWAKLMKMFMEKAAMVITKENLIPVDPEIVNRWKPKSTSKEEDEAMNAYLKKTNRLLVV